MTTIPTAQRRNRGASLALVSALALAGCHPSTGASSDQAMIANPPSLPATLPLAAGTATRAAIAPSADRLPAAAPLGLVRVANPGDAYAYADDAWDFGDAVFDAPPDYGFDYNGVEPWAWEGYDRSTTFIEPIDGGYRYYYYRPGADQPYYVRDPDYGYGYDNGQLAAIYAANGALIPYADYGPRAEYAARYRARGRALYEASHARQRRAVVAANWAARSAAISAAQSRLAANRAQQDAWRAYHARTAAQQDGHWQQERTRRQADATRFADWRQGGFRAAPPPRVIPANWQQAKWARDDHRYVVAPAPAPGGRAADHVQRDAQIQAGRREEAAQRDAQRQQQAALAAGRQQQIVTQRADQGPRGAMRDRQDPGGPQRQDLRREPQGAHAPAQPDQARAQVEAKRQADRAAQRAVQAQQRATVQQQRGNERVRARPAAPAEARSAPAAARQQERQQAQAAQGQARAQAQAARQQAQGQARQQAEAARGTQRAQQQAARAQVQAARPAPARMQPRPQPQRPQPQHNSPPAGDGDHGNGGGKGHKPG